MASVKQMRRIAAIAKKWIGYPHYDILKPIEGSRTIIVYPHYIQCQFAIDQLVRDIDMHLMDIPHTKHSIPHTHFPIVYVLP
jgi:hypothetical protein